MSKLKTFCHPMPTEKRHELNENHHKVENEIAELLKKARTEILPVREIAKLSKLSFHLGQMIALRDHDNIAIKKAIHGAGD
jgi:hypothetical protein